MAKWLHASDRIYLVIELSRTAGATSSGTKKSTRKRYALIKVPDCVYGRWVRLPSKTGFHDIMYLDDVIRHCLPLVFLGLKGWMPTRAHSFKFTKDAEMEVEPDADFGPLERVALGVDSRKNGATVHGLLKPLDVKEREARFKLREDRSDVIVPAAEIFLRACAYLKCDVIIVPNISLADAIVDGLYERLLT